MLASQTKPFSRNLLRSRAGIPSSVSLSLYISLVMKQLCLAYCVREKRVRRLSSLMIALGPRLAGMSKCTRDGCLTHPLGVLACNTGVLGSMQRGRKARPTLGCYHAC